MVNRIAIALCVLIGVLVSGSLWRAGYATSMCVSPLYNDESVNLRIVLVYNGDKPVKIYKSDLPWGAGRNFVLTPHVINKMYYLEKMGYVSGPLAETMVLEPHHEYVGVVYLGVIYKNIRSVHVKSNVLFHWTYELRDWNGTELSTVEGSTLVRKTEEGH